MLCGAAAKRLRRARIAVLGTVNPSTATVVFVKMLELKGAKVSLYDPTSKRDTSDSASSKNQLKRGSGRRRLHSDTYGRGTI